MPLRKNKEEGLDILDIKTYHWTPDIRTLWFCHVSRGPVKQNKNSRNKIKYIRNLVCIKGGISLLDKDLKK